MGPKAVDCADGTGTGATCSAPDNPYTPRAARRAPALARGERLDYILYNSSALSYIFLFQIHIHCVSYLSDGTNCIIS